MAALRLLTPVITLSACAFLLLAVDASIDSDNHKENSVGMWLTLLGLIAAAVLIPMPGAEPLVFGRQMLVWDGLAYFISWLSVITGALVVLMGIDYAPLRRLRQSAYFALLLFAIAGTILLAAANDFLMIFLSIEMVSLPSFILAGYFRHRERSSEAALKFFLIGAFSSAMLAYGVSLLYGLTGTTSLGGFHPGDLVQTKAPLMLLACMFVLVGFGFKIALVPFHVWLPDTFEEAPAPVAAFLSVAPKMAAAITALRVFGSLVHPAPHAITLTLALLAGLTMTLANVIALRQRNILRLLAYSSVSHMGYLLLGVIAGTPDGTASVFVYGWIYLFMNLGAFAAVSLVVGQTGSGDYRSLSGLGKRNPLLAAMLTFFLCALAGVPPTAGFLSKFYVLSAAFHAGWIKLVFLAAFNTVIAMAYYFRVMRVMYFEEPVEEQRLPVGVSSLFTLAVTSFFTLLLGVAPQIFLSRAGQLVPGEAIPAVIQTPTPVVAPIPLAPASEPATDSMENDSE